MRSLTFETEGHVGWLRLNRPEVHNAISVTLLTELAALTETIVADGDIRVVIIAGNGPSFSSGIDLSDLQSTSLRPDPLAKTTGGEKDANHVGIISRLQAGYRNLAEAPFATIAAVHGHALGAGLQLALACDLRVVARGTEMGLLERRYGLLPDLGGTYWLPRLVGPSRAKQLIWTATCVDAEEAFRIGLADQIVNETDLELTAAELARDLVAASPRVLSGAKRLIDGASGQTLAEGLNAVAEEQAGCLTAPEFVAAVTAVAGASSR